MGFRTHSLHTYIHTYTFPHLFGRNSCGKVKLLGLLVLLGDAAHEYLSMLEVLRQRFDHLKIPGNVQSVNTPANLRRHLHPQAIFFDLLYVCVYVYVLCTCMCTYYVTGRLHVLDQRYTYPGTVKLLFVSKRGSSRRW